MLKIIFAWGEKNPANAGVLKFDEEMSRAFILDEGIYHETREPPGVAPVNISYRYFLKEKATHSITVKDQNSTLSKERE